MVQKIYFDESGFTGNNLLHPQQKYFAYGSVATNDEEAREFVSELIKKYKIQNSELKGRDLAKFSKGRKAIDEIFVHFEGRIKVTVSDKKFALACKLFEYIFEPCLSEINSLFYSIGFNRFIANILYVEFLARGAGAEPIFSEFEELMRGRGEPNLRGIFSSSAHRENSPIITKIREFAQYRADDIHQELASLRGNSTGKWILDLTQTALYTLLANWGTEHEVLTAICDQSNPLEQHAGFLDVMIGRQDRLFSEASGQRHPITFNLSGPIEFRDSKVTHGVQIADALAAATVHAYSGADDDHAKRWRTILPAIGKYGSVIPDWSELNLMDTRAQRNAAVLLELHSRATSGISLTDGMAGYVQFVTERLVAMPYSLLLPRELV